MEDRIAKARPQRRKILQEMDAEEQAAIAKSMRTDAGNLCQLASSHLMEALTSMRSRLDAEMKTCAKRFGGEDDWRATFIQRPSCETLKKIFLAQDLRG